MIKFTVITKKSFGTWQFGKIDVLVNLIIQKILIKQIQFDQESYNQPTPNFGPPQYPSQLLSLAQNVNQSFCDTNHLMETAVKNGTSFCLSK